jgi:predicted nucleic acid-binding protein
MAIEPAFVGTNVLVYRAWQAAPQHHAAVTALQALAGAGAACWLSRQVLREYACVVTRPLAQGPIRAPAEAVADIRWLAQRFEVAEGGADVTARLLDLLLSTQPPASRSTTPISWQRCWHTESDVCSPSTPPTSRVTPG